MLQITSISDNCIKLIEYYETSNNLKKYLKAYLCPAGVWTIGIGTTVYPNGTRVKAGDIITPQQAYDFLWFDLRGIQQSVAAYTNDNINQNQFDSLVSFAYNLGTYALKSSTLLKKLNANLNDPTIQKEFERWVHANGKVLPGLVKRRKSEAWLYFKGELKFDF